MSAATDSKSETARRFYDATALAAQDFSFMNYGYAPAGAAPASGPEGYCLALYHHLLGDARLKGRRVLEVSCGRGGGAAEIAARYAPAELVGLDISEQNLGLARRRFAHVKNLRFEIGRAEKLPFEDASFDAAVNVEASHLYDDPARFFAEVIRVLRPGGRFFYADLSWQNSDPAGMLRAAGFSIAREEDITADVLRALELDSERRELIVSGSIPQEMQHDYRNWSGVKGYRAYNRFASREWVYRAFWAERGRASGEPVAGG
jgi:SAM-dependent methyltransferase